MLKTIVFTFMISLNAFVVVQDTIMLWSIATNTLNSVRELSSIVRETREFGESFERIYSEVDQKIWAAERAVMWLEDMKQLSRAEINNLDEFNNVLRELKHQTGYLRGEMLRLHNQNKNTKAEKEQFRKDTKRSANNFKKYSGSRKYSMSPQMAQVETAKNTKDMLIEIARQNHKIDRQGELLAKLVEIVENQEQERLDSKLLKIEKWGNIKKGVLSTKEGRKR